MLQLLHNGSFVELVRPGTTVRLPNGDYLSPALEGWNQNGYSLEVYEAPAEPDPIPVTVTLEDWRSTAEISQFQAHATLELWGLREQAKALAEAVGGLVLIGFERASVWRRSSPTVNGLFGSLTLADGSPVTDDLVDEFFRQAEGIVL